MCDTNVKCYMYIKKVKCDTKKESTTMGSPTNPVATPNTQVNRPPDDPNTPDVNEALVQELNMNDTGTNLAGDRQLPTGSIDPNYAIIWTSQQGDISDTYVKHEERYRIDSKGVYKPNEEIQIRTLFDMDLLAGKTVTVVAPKMQQYGAWTDTDDWRMNNVPIIWTKEGNDYVSNVYIQRLNEIKFKTRNQSNMIVHHEWALWWPNTPNP